jgi:hypothetical protein
MSFSISSFASGVVDRIKAATVDAGEKLLDLPKDAANAAKGGFDKVVDTVDDIDLPNWYGNFGGPGSEPGKANMGKPIDDLDAAFQKHDKAYGKDGYFNLSADAELLKDSASVLVSPDASIKERAAALTTGVVFAGVVVPFISGPTTAYRESEATLQAIGSGAVDLGSSAWNGATSWI